MIKPITVKLRKLNRAGFIAVRDTVTIAAIARRRREAPETCSKLMCWRDKPCGSSFNHMEFGTRTGRGSQPLPRKP